METKKSTMLKPEQIILKNEKFGNPISEKLSTYLRTYTGKDDRANVSTVTGVGASTIRDVVFRTNSLTRNNSKGIIELIKLAIHNCENSIDDAEIAIDELQSVLKKA